MEENKVREATVWILDRLKTIRKQFDRALLNSSRTSEQLDYYLEDLGVVRGVLTDLSKYIHSDYEEVYTENKVEEVVSFISDADELLVELWHTIAGDAIEVRYKERYNRLANDEVVLNTIKREGLDTIGIYVYNNATHNLLDFLASQSEIDALIFLVLWDTEHNMKQLLKDVKEEIDTYGLFSRGKKHRRLVAYRDRFHDMRHYALEKFRDRQLRVEGMIVNGDAYSIEDTIAVSSWEPNSKFMKNSSRTINEIENIYLEGREYFTKLGYTI